jgi:hypothetical protein
MKDRRSHRLLNRVQAFEFGLSKLGFKVCDLKAGRKCDLGSGCGRHRIVRGVDLCDKQYR